MVENMKILLGSGNSLKKSGVFNFNKLYAEMKDWISEHGYDFTEKGFTDKNLDTGKEIIVDWIGEREITDYIKYIFKVKISINKAIPSSENLLNGNIQILFSADLEVDYKKKWGETALSNFLFKIYLKHIIKSEIEKNKAKLKEEILDLHETAKEVLEFYR